MFRKGKSFALFPFRVYYAPLEAATKPHTDSDLSLAPGQVCHGSNSAGSGSGPGSSSGQRLKAGFGASSRNFKRAVDRNRIKRLTREAYRLQKQDLLEFLEINGLALAIFIIYTGKEVPDYQTVREKIGVALQKLVKQLGT
ncbi:ribonuclease P protein component [Flavitalea flava]